VQEDPPLQEVIAVPAALTDWQGLKYASKSTQIASALKTDKDHHSRDRQWSRGFGFTVDSSGIISRWLDRKTIDRLTPLRIEEGGDGG